MILVLITIVLALSGVLFGVLGKDSDFEIPFMITTITSAVLTIVLITAFACTHIGTEKTIIGNEIEYKALIKQVELINSDYEDVSKTMVVQNVAEWNKKVNKTKYFAENPWTNWLCNKKVADNLKFIDM